MAAKTALVVDDSKSARFALRKYLENHDFAVDTAESAEAAYSFLQTKHPEVIFLDHVMPGTDGFEALRHIKNDPQTLGIPVVICSSNEGEAFNREACSKGAAGVLQKPPSPEQLTRILDNLQQLSVSLRNPPTPAPAPVVIPPPAPPKVTNIREPDVAIEQAVMKVLRNAMPPRSEPVSAPVEADSGPTVPVSPPRLAPSLPANLNSTAAFMASAIPPPSSLQTTGSFMAAGNGGNLRDQIDERIRKVTQDLFVQVAALKADLQQLEDRASDAGSGANDAQVREVVRDELAAVQDQLRGLEDSMANQLSELQLHTDANFTLMEQRLEQLAQAARQTAAEEAHAVAERVVMSAASRIADQLAESILRAFHAPKN